MSADAAVAAPAAPAAPAAFAFGDDAPSVDPAAAILDEVLSGGSDSAVADAPDEGAAADAPAEGQPAEAKPAEAKPDAPAEPPEAIRLRKGFAKLAGEQQKLVERENAARTAIASAKQYEEKARRHDELVSAIEKDPAGFLLTHGGDALVKKALQGFIDQEKSPAEREVAKLREEQKADREARERREQETIIERWRNDIAAKVQADERFDLVNAFGLHHKVIDVITGYYEKHSERDDKGNIVKPALLPWDIAAQAVEDTESGKFEKSKRYGKREPAAAAPATAPAKKDAPPAKPIAPAKKAPTSLSSVPVAESPASPDDGPSDPEERQAWLLKELGF